MTLLSLGYIAMLVVAAFCIAAAILLAAMMFRSAGPAPRRAPPPEIGFLFDGDRLVDATDAGRRLLDYAQRIGSDMETLVAFLAPRFPDLARRVADCGEDETLYLLSAGADARLRICARDGRLRLSLDYLDGDTADLPCRFVCDALTEALDRHRLIADAVPAPVWQQDREGRVVWANRACRELSGTVTAAQGGGGPPFRELDIPTGVQGGAQRLSLTRTEDEAQIWFDCHVRPAADGVTVTALPADATVRAESALRDFVQTLTRTFAHLSVGLAIFDNSRVLTVFNPALGDILGLPAEFLVSRPTLSQMLDRLRERRMIPEPKNYHSWRAQMHALEVAAADGRFAESWPMPDGRTVRVTGRPHPGGAVAFMFEDISDEIAATRRYRDELRVGQAVIEGLDEAIAVFTPGGRISLANRAYAELWDIADPAGLCGQSIFDASRRWQERCAPTPVWGDARDFAAAIGERTNWTAEVRLGDGRRLCCRFETLPGGATLAAFQPQKSPAVLPDTPRLASVHA